MIAFAGAVQRDARACNDAGIDAFFPILRGVVTLEEAMKNENAKQNLADTAEQVIRLMKYKDIEENDTAKRQAIQRPVFCSL